MNELRVKIVARFFVSGFLISLHFTSCHHEFPDKNLRGMDGLLRSFLHIANKGATDASGGTFDRSGYLRFAADPL